jgi:hypothetical protein
MMIATTTPMTIPAIAPPLRPEPESSVGDALDDGLDDELDDGLDDGEGVVVAQEYDPVKTSPLSPSSAFCLSMPLHPAEPVETIEDSPLTRSRFSKERLYLPGHQRQAQRAQVAKGKKPTY